MHLGWQNVIKEPLKLDFLHAGESQPGCKSVGAKLFSPKVGIKLDRWFCKWGRWLASLAIASEVFFMVPLPFTMPWRLRHVGAAFPMLLAGVSLLLGLRISVVKKLLGVASVWCVHSCR